MKNCKKIFSVILAVIMLVCTMSFAFTAEAKVKKPAKVTGLKQVESFESDAGQLIFYNTIRWKRQKGVKGYQIYFSHTGGKVTKKGWKNNYHTYGFKPMGRNAADAYVKVRAYKVVKGKRLYGPWSKKIPA